MKRLNTFISFITKKSNRLGFIIIAVFVVMYILTSPYRKKPILLKEINVGKIESIKLLRKDGLLGDIPYYEIKTSNGNMIVYSDIWKVENIGLHHRIGSKARIQVYSDPAGVYSRGYFRSEGTEHTFYVGNYGKD